MTFDVVVCASYLTKALALLTCFLLIFRVTIRPLLVWAIALAITAVLLVNLYLVFPAREFGFDYQIFWKAGEDVCRGLDPYDPERFAEHPFLQPPTALPIFALFALCPLRLSLAVWTGVNALACLALVALAQHTLTAQELRDDCKDWQQRDSWRLSPPVLAGLTAALAVSDASMLTFYTGQLSILVALFLLAAIHAQSRGRPVWAGFWLALATIKVATMLPFLMLFYRKSDRWTWISLGLTVLCLCLMTGRATDLPGRLSLVLEHIKELEAPGQVNDYSFEGTQHETILGFHHLLYRLGLRDRELIAIAAYVVLFSLGAWIAVRIVNHALSPAAACSLVACYSAVFLYHRGYDTVILVLPLVYSTGRARSARGRARWLFAASAVGLLLVLYLNKDFLQVTQKPSMGWGVWEKLVQATVLPYATWLILLVVICLGLGVGPACTTIGVRRKGEVGVPEGSLCP